MATAIRVPDLGTTVDEVKLVSWLVAEGDTVTRGQPIAEIETDKAVSELECVAAGVLLKQVVEPDQTVETGAVLAYVGQPGEAIPEGQAEPGGQKPEAPAKDTPPTPAPGGKPPRISPLVRNLAKKLGVDLTRVTGTGRRGMITREDVVQASQGGPAGQGAPAAEPLSRAQSAVARAVSASNRDIPHLRISAEIDMTAANRIRAQSEAAGAKVSYDAIVVKAVAEAIRAVPLVAARLDGQQVVHPDGVHVAVAIGFDNELVLPVVRDADRKDLGALHADIADLAGQAKAHTLKADRMTGGCITVSNLGMYPIESFDAIIFPEHSCILSLGAVRDRLVAENGGAFVRPMVTAKLAADHRLINGRTAAAFLTKVMEAMESGTLS